jgi:hypothetical protein
MSGEKRNPLEGNPQNYRKIVILITGAFVIEAPYLNCFRNTLRVTLAYHPPDRPARRADAS